MFTVGVAQRPRNPHLTFKKPSFSGFDVKLSTPVGRSSISPGGIAGELNAGYTLRDVVTKARKGSVSAPIGIGGRELVYISGVKLPIPEANLWVFVTRL